MEIVCYQYVDSMKASCEAMAIDGSDYSISDLRIQHFIYLY